MGNDQPVMPTIQYWGVKRPNGCLDIGEVLDFQMIDGPGSNWSGLEYRFFYKSWDKSGSGFQSALKYYTKIDNRIFTVEDLIPLQNGDTSNLSVSEVMNDGFEVLRTWDELSMQLHFKVMCDLFGAVILDSSNGILTNQHPSIDFERYIADMSLKIAYHYLCTSRVTSILYLLEKSLSYRRNHGSTVEINAELYGLAVVCFVFGLYEKADDYRREYNGALDLHTVCGVFSIGNDSHDLEHSRKRSYVTWLIDNGRYQRAIDVAEELCRDPIVNATIKIKCLVKQGYAYSQLGDNDKRDIAYWVALRKIVSPEASILFKLHRNDLPVVIVELINHLRDQYVGKVANFSDGINGNNIIHEILSNTNVTEHAVAFVKILIDLDVISLDHRNNNGETPLELASSNVANNGRWKFKLMAMLIAYQNLQVNQIQFIPQQMKDEIRDKIGSFASGIKRLDVESLGTPNTRKQEIDRVDTLVTNLLNRVRTTPETYIIISTAIDLLVKLRIKILIDPSNPNLGICEFGHATWSDCQGIAYLRVKLVDCIIKLGTRRGDIEVISTLIHEIFHMVTHIVKQNIGNPFNNYFEKSIYEPIIENMKTRYRANPNTVHVVFHGTMCSGNSNVYTEADYHREILANVGQLLVLNNGLQILKTQEPALWNYVFHHWVCDIRDYDYMLKK